MSQCRCDQIAKAKMRQLSFALVVSLLSTTVRPFSVRSSYDRYFTRLGSAAGPEAIELKTQLLDAISAFREVSASEGDVSVDFGVKGGELNETSRAPQKVDFFAVSPAVGKAADTVLEVCTRLGNFNPTSNATKYLGDKAEGEKAPLHGSWKLLFSTAADASFSKNSTRGDAQAQNIVDAKVGKITNVIDFLPVDGKPRALEQLRVVIKATALNAQRVGLQFRYAQAKFTRFSCFPIRWSLYIPVPGPFITRMIVFFNRLLRFGRRGVTKPPKAFFDVVYLDDELRIHKTGEDNIFVQARPSWQEASGFFKS